MQIHQGRREENFTKHAPSTMGSLGSGELSDWTMDEEYDYSGSGMDDPFVNMTARFLTCQQRRDLGNPLPLSMTIVNALRSTQVIYYMICYPIAFLLNVFALFIIARFKKLHNITFFLALQIIIANLANIVVYYPYSSTNAIANRDVFARICPVMGFITDILLTARHLLMFVVIADRFCLIFLPFWYSRHRVKVAIPLSIGGWMLALIISLIPLIGLRKCYAFQRFTWVCMVGNGCNMPECNAYATFVIVLRNGGTFVAFFLYLVLYWKAKKLQNKVTIAPQSTENAEEQEAVKESRKRERRANNTFLILFTALVGVTFPSFLFFALGRAVLVALSITPPPPAFIVIAIMLGSLYLLIFIMDPIVIMRNQDVREVIQIITAKLRPPTCTCTCTCIHVSSQRVRIAPSSTTNETENSGT